MRDVVNIGLFIIAAVGALIMLVSWEIYVREGGPPSRPHFEVQRTPRERQLGRWYRTGSLLFCIPITVVLAIDIFVKYVLSD